MAMIPYDDRDGQIWFDGKLVPWRDAKVHFLTHALHYGSGVFEGVRAYGGNIFKLNDHSQRMLDGCKMMDMKITYTLDQINQACIDVLKANKLTDAYLRPLAWRGPEQMGVAAQQTKIHLAVAAWEWPSYFSPEMREKGISIQTSRWRRPAPDMAPVTAKACGLYMICTLSKHDADRNGFTDALMHDYRGNVAELTGANFFMIKNGELHTPITDCILNGITRLTVIEMARGMGIKVNERHIKPEELKDGEEFFCTGTAAEVTPIGKIDNNTFAVGPITRKIRDEYEKMVRMPVAAQQKKAAG
jgi:branched-chain amino acid aminotransferase